MRVRGRRGVLLLALILLLVAAGVVTAVLVRGTGTEQRLVQEARTLRADVRRAKHLRLRLARVFPTRRPAAQRRLERETLNEAEPPTPQSTGSALVNSASQPQTNPAAISRAPRPNDFALFQRSLVSIGSASFTAEPSVAAKGGRILETWNWGAALSTHGGRSFSFVDPETRFPSAHDGFCCDQLALYAGPSDLWLWLLQYSGDATGNILRLATARGDAAFDSGSFSYFDFAPTTFGLGQSVSFDFNGLATTTRNLFVSTNVFGESGYARTLVFRVPLADVVAGRIDLSHVQYMSEDLGTARLTSGATDTMYFASHVDRSHLRIWSWPDESDSVSHVDVAHAGYAHPERYHCARTRGSATSDWCLGKRKGDFKNDDRPLAGWVSNGRVGFAWNAPQDPASGFPYPFVMAVEVDQSSMRLVGEPFIWSRKAAYQYAAIAPDARGDLGGMVLRGGGAGFESCVALVRDPFSTRSASGWEAHVVAASTVDPAEPRAGDYLGVALAGPGSNSWIGSCMTVGGRGNREDVSVRYFSFGRNGDAPG